MANSKKIEKILNSLSLEDKVRQLLQINADFVKTDMKIIATGVSGNMKLTADDIFGVGSVLNTGGAENALAVRDRYLEQSKNKIPLVLMDDVIHGYRTIFPIPLAVGCSFNPEGARRCAEMAAREASACGVDVAFSPMVNLSRDARWGRGMEAYGEDGYLNGLFGRAVIRGYHDGGLACCVKHYAVYGAAEAGRDYNTTDISEHNLREYYLPIFEECLKENPELVMTSFNLLNGVPVNADSHLLLDILRDEWGYDGVVISDYGAVVEMINHGFAATERECALVAANNQVDMEMMSAAYLHHLPQLVAENKVPLSTVDSMVRRVLQLKEKLNLFENPHNKTDVEASKRICLCKEHRKIAREAAAESFVLLENNGVLPLNRSAKVALVGPLATERNILGAWACAGRHSESVTVAEGLENLLGQKVPCAAGCKLDLFSSDESMFDEALRTAECCDVVVACVGEHSYWSGESASRTDIRLPRIQVKLLERLKQLNKPLVAVVFGGRPLEISEVKNFADAILYVWQPGTEGGNAIAETLYGRCPSGKLTVSFPRSVGQCPLYYNHFNTGRPKLSDELTGHKYSSSYMDQLNAPLYPFGYGLSYTRFSYGTPTISATQMRRGQRLTVRVTVQNCGNCDGGEVVQLYLRDKFASCARPVKELKAFSKIHLQKGESREVVFEIDEEMLKFHNAKGQFVAEAGTFDVSVGGDSTVPPFASFELLD